MTVEMLKLGTGHSGLSTASPEVESSDTPPMSQEGLARKLECSFAYPCGLQDPDLDLFDVRPEICRTFGACHGDIVLGSKGIVATVIGVKLDRKGMPRLYSHAYGAKGAGLFDPTVHLRVVARVASVPEGGPEDSDDEEHHSYWWLEQNFGYRCGLSNPTYALFDIRDEICEKVGGFRHGNVVRTPQGRECIVIGVRHDPDDDTVAMWFHPKGTAGAGIFDIDSTESRPAGLELIGQEVVEEVEPGSLPDAAELARPETYPFPDPDVQLHCNATDTTYYVASHLTKAAEVKAVVVFFPGVHGGVGPGRTPGENYDPNAIFPTLARRISSEYPADCYRVSWQAMFPSMSEGMRGGLLVVHHALARIQDSCRERHPESPMPEIRVILVGHSFGGAAALQCAKFLHTRILGPPGQVPAPESSGCTSAEDENAGGGSAGDSETDETLACTVERPAIFSAARLVGLATLAAQFRGAVEVVASLDESVAKAFVHGTEDAVLPVDTVHTLYEQAREPKELYVVEGAGHDMQPYKESVLSFLDDFLRPKCGTALDFKCPDMAGVAGAV